jgi:hypothetical protein
MMARCGSGGISLATINSTLQRPPEASPLTIGPRREPTVSAELNAFKERAEQVMRGEVLFSSRGTPSVPGVTDELPPAYDGNSRADNHAAKLHTEIKLNGKVIGRVYNSGVSEFADDYAFLARGSEKDTTTGPELAQLRVARAKAALERHGMISTDALEGQQPKTNFMRKADVFDILRASTAQTQQEWLAFKATEPPMPGAYVSRSA